MAVDSYGAGLFFVLGTAALAICGLLLFRRAVSHESLRHSHEVAGYLLSVVGTMYAVLLGLVVVDSMARFQAAENNVQSEANYLADVFLLSEKYPPDKEAAIKDLCIKYVQRVIDVEWKGLDDGVIDMDCRRMAIRLMRTVQDFEPKTQSQQSIYPIAVQEVCQLWDCRRTRTNQAQRGTPPEEWVVLIVGGLVTIFFTYFFTMTSLKLQMTMTGMVGAVIALNLLLVLWFGYPFSGDRKVHASPLQVDQKLFQNQLGNHVELEFREHQLDRQMQLQLKSRKS